jgi:nicotinamidase-related amidase
MTQTALLVIDIQRGAFDGVRCPPMDEPGQLLQAAGRLVEAAREGGRPIVFVQHCEAAPGDPFEEGSVHWRLHESLQPAPADVQLLKHASSAFEGTTLDAQLKARGVDRLVVCGLQSEHCVSNTTRSALALGYAVQLAEDGHGTWTWNGRSASEIRAEVNQTLGAAGAVLAPTEQLAQALAQT